MGVLGYPLKKIWFSDTWGEVCTQRNESDEVQRHFLDLIFAT